MKTRITMDLPNNLIEHIDNISSKTFRSRTQFVIDAIIQHIDKFKDVQFLQDCSDEEIQNAVKNLEEK